MRWPRWAAFFVLIAAVPLVIIWHEHIWWWIEVHTGTVNEPGPYYGFFSGFGSDLAELAIIGGLVSIYRKHNCTVHGCWRIGRHPVAGTAFVTCRRHHPDDPVTHQDVIDAHQAAKAEGQP